MRMPGLGSGRDSPPLGLGQSSVMPITMSPGATPPLSNSPPSTSALGSLGGGGAGTQPSLTTLASLALQAVDKNKHNAVPAGKPAAAAAPGGTVQLTPQNLLATAKAYMDDWLNLQQDPVANEKLLVVYVSNLLALLKGEEAQLSWFRLFCDVVVEYYSNSASSTASGASGALASSTTGASGSTVAGPAGSSAQLNFAAVDAYAKLVTLTIRVRRVLSLSVFAPC
jgi:hypothetical protein